MTINTVAENLQYLITNLSQVSLTHSMQARVFESLGYKKLAKKYKEHADEEMCFVEQFIDRLLDLGVDVKNEKKQAEEIFKDPIECIKYDLKVSKDGISWLKKVVDDSKDDFKSYEILKEYYIDEEEDMYWYESQLELVQQIGLQNYLMSNL